MQIVSRAPTRIDLAGGTLDLWPLYLFEEGAITINVAINLFATARLSTTSGNAIQIISKDQNLEETAADLQSLKKDGKLALLSRLIHHFAPSQGLRLETDCMAPAGSGLGGSSALAIAVCGALNELTGKRFSPEDLIGIARDVEAQVIGIPTGEQDYYAAVYGGLNAWHFGVQKVERETYNLPLEEIQDRLLLFYTGVPRASGINNWQVFKNRIDGDPNAASALRTIKQETLRLHEALKNEDWGEVYEAIHNEWEARKTLAPSITTPEIEELIEFGITNGSRTGRVCGAGGGGCVFFLIDSFTRPYLYDLSKERGYKILDFEAVSEGLKVSAE
jgi:D-glycero-alpha-D-manno-heptose-7-phosphate kinase